MTAAESYSQEPTNIPPEFQMQTVEDALTLARTEARAMALARTDAEAKGLAPAEIAEAVNQQKKFSTDELTTMGPTLQELYRDHNLLSPQSTLDEVGRWRLGYVIAHYALRMTARENKRPLRALAKSFMYEYVTFAEDDPHGLKVDFTRDYILPDHTAPIKLVAEMLPFEANRVGAMVMFGLYGQWANPARGYIAPPKPSLKRVANRQKSQGLIMLTNRRGKNTR